MKRPGAELRFSGSSLPRRGSSHLIYCDEPSPTHTSQGGFIPTTAANLLTIYDNYSDLMSDQSANSGLLLRRRNKVVGFIVAEAVAIGLLLIAGSFALLVRRSDSTLAFSINILTITAAAAVAVIPIAFFAVAPILPRRR